MKLKKNQIIFLTLELFEILSYLNKQITWIYYQNISENQNFLTGSLINLKKLKNQKISVFQIKKKNYINIIRNKPTFYNITPYDNSFIYLKYTLH